MCGRYYVDDETAREIERLVRKVSAEMAGQKKGDIRPSEKSVALIGEDAHMAAKMMYWGFPQQTQKGLLINARSESVLEKPTFRDSIQKRRCIIPARKYYEWDADKNKAVFSREDGGLLYMAGFYNLYSEQDRFVILTTQANESVRRTHDRMPLILEGRELEDWLYDSIYWKYVLKQIPAQLKKYQEYEQLSLF